MPSRTAIDPRVLWPLAYLTGRLGYQLEAHGIEGPDRDVLTLDLVRDGVAVHVDWFPRTDHIFVSQDGELLSVHTTFVELAEALEALPARS